MKLHVITACTRMENLPLIAGSLVLAESAGVDLTWHVRFDPARQAVGGQALKNAMLGQVADGWVWICDDDNCAHPDLFGALASIIATSEAARLIVVAQQHRGGWVRHVHRQMLRQTHVDAGQVIIRRDAIGEMRIPLHYCGDGEWIEALANTLTGNQIGYIYEPVCYYNWLRND